MIVIKWYVEDGAAYPLEQERELDEWEEKEYRKLETEIDRQSFVDDIVYEEFKQNIDYTVDRVEDDEED
jgi:hypothetical protein